MLMFRKVKVIKQYVQFASIFITKFIHCVSTLYKYRNLYLKDGGNNHKNASY